MVLSRNTQLAPQTLSNVEPDRPTPAELAVLALIAKGLKVPGIAEARRCKRRTVEFQVSKLYQKSGTNSYVLLVAWGVSRGYCQYLQFLPIDR